MNTTTYHNCDWIPEVKAQSLGVWQPIETAPKDSSVIDLWCGQYNVRMPDYMRVNMGNGNIFYDPVYCGRSTVRTATHWMYAPKPPKEIK